MPKLKNPKRERFCQEYIKDLNATQAFIRAGYSKKGAKQNALKVMTNNDLKERIKELGGRTTEKIQLTTEKVLKDIEDVRNLAAKDKQWRSALKASELQGKYLTLFTEKHEVTGANGGPIETEFLVEFVNMPKKT